MTDMRETQETIAKWGDETFGPVAHPSALARRARIEMDELIETLERNDAGEAARETADAVDAKMKINRARRWVSSGDGAGRHTD